MADRFGDSLTPQRKKLKDDPAVMGLEILNEDSLFFWTFNYDNVPPPLLALLESRFAGWLAAKYGTLGAAFAKWNEPQERDQESEGRAGFLPHWAIDQEAAKPAFPRHRPLFGGSATGVFHSDAGFPARGNRLPSGDLWLQLADGQIEWLINRGIFTVRAARSQGVSGYLARAGKIELPDLTIESPLPFGVVWAVAMDGKPLAESKKMLRQVMTEQQNSGFRTEGGRCARSLRRGKPRWKFVPSLATCASVGQIPLPWGSLRWM